MQLRPLSRSFFSAPVDAVAQSLLGCVLVHDTIDGRSAGRIVETEAYHQTDPASHSYCGPTPRNQVMYGPGGFTYVYRSYGIHWCMNVTVGPVGEGAAVLLRALEPLEGIALMLARRAMGSTPRDLRNVARGPGCVARAMGITAAHNGVDLLGSSLFIAAGPVAVTASQVIATPRIGISKATDVLWRFVIAGHPCASGRRGANR